MILGDLVRFESGVRSWQLRYKERNPGVVIGFHEGHNFTGKVTTSMTVLWANGEVSSEHEGYLQTVSSK
tara:strand:- start:97 stop:303 length:207 start_codon:yes stop_codon:yes gene_type:complete